MTVAECFRKLNKMDAQLMSDLYDRKKSLTKEIAAEIKQKIKKARFALDSDELFMRAKKESIKALKEVEEDLKDYVSIS